MLIKDKAHKTYSTKRISHWNSVATTKCGVAGSFYQKLLCHYYAFLIPPNLKVLEIGSGTGNLLNSLRPAKGLGIDFSSEMTDRAKKRYPHLKFLCADAHTVTLTDQYDVIILSDILNDVWDVQHLLLNLRQCCHKHTRIVSNFFSNVWRVPLSIARKCKLARPVMDQNWLSPEDIKNLLYMSGFEEISRKTFIGLPVPIPFLSAFINRYIVHFFPFSLFALTNFSISRPIPNNFQNTNYSVSIIIAARNEAGHIEELLSRIPRIGNRTEVIFIEGGSSDNTYDQIKSLIHKNALSNVLLFQQTGKGKGDAVRLGFQKATGDIVLILDADMTVAPEDLSKFVDALVQGHGEFINGVRLVYPMDDEAMRFFNIIGNKFFSMAFSWLLSQNIKDTLCGTKVMWRKDYENLAHNRQYFGDFDPFGDFDLIFGAAKMNLKIIDMPIRYRNRTYGTTNISRWSSGWLLFKMVLFAANRLKFI